MKGKLTAAGPCFISAPFSHCLNGLDNEAISWMTREYADSSGTHHIRYFEEASVGALIVVPRNTVWYKSRLFLKPRAFVPLCLFPHY